MEKLTSHDFGRGRRRCTFSAQPKPERQRGRGTTPPKQRRLANPGNGRVVEVSEVVERQQEMHQHQQKHERVRPYNHPVEQPRKDYPLTCSECHEEVRFIHTAGLCCKCWLRLYLVKVTEPWASNALLLRDHRIATHR